MFSGLRENYSYHFDGLLPYKPLHARSGTALPFSCRTDLSLIILQTTNRAINSSFQKAKRARAGGRTLERDALRVLIL